MAESDSKPSGTPAQNIPGCPMRAKGLSEEEVGKKFDICLANTAVKTAAGFGIGALMSLVLFKRKYYVGRNLFFFT